MQDQQNTPQISVLMSVYNPDNREIFFDAIRSIISQTFEDWEMILYDDGSDEEGKDLIIEASKLDERIIYARGEKNRGLGYGLNVATGLSKGKYLARMDSDDISKPERFARQLEFLEKNPQFQWVGSNAELINSKGRWGIWRMPKEPVPKDFLRFSPFIHPSVMFRREVLVQNGGYTTVNRRSQDYTLFMDLYSKGFRGYNIQKILFSYREEKVSYKRRKISSSLYEVKIRHDGFKKLGIMGPKACLYIIKPIVMLIIPNPLIAAVKRRKRKGTYVERQRR